MTSVAAIPECFDFSNKGKRTVLYDYCEDNSRKNSACIFICTISGRQAFARDIAVDPESRMIALGDYVRWWDRLSLFGPIGVRSVEAKFLSGERSSRGFQVVVRHPDHACDVEAIEGAIRFLQTEIDSGVSCGVDVNGERHEGGCENESYDPDDNKTFCRVTRAQHLRLQVDLIKWMPCYLDYFWQHRAQRHGIEFLEKKGFFYKYRDLAYDRFTRPEELYGGPINAIELVRGLKVERLLWTTLAALICDVCIVAFACLLTKILAGGIAISSYAAALQTILFAFLTMLSAVLA